MGIGMRLHRLISTGPRRARLGGHPIDSGRAVPVVDLGLPGAASYKATGDNDHAVVAPCSEPTCRKITNSGWSNNQGRTVTNVTISPRNHTRRLLSTLSPFAKAFSCSGC